LIYILDAAALLNDENFYFDKMNKYFTTNLVFDEWKDFQNKTIAENALSAGILSIADPSEESINAVISFLGKSNTKVSSADISIVALSFEFKEKSEPFVVITDDYSVQNSLKKMKINFQGVIHKEIKKSRSFKSQNQFQN